MLDGLFGRRFTSKCKSLMKHIGTRIDLIRKRRNAMQTNLKKDIAELLAKCLDDIAYGRAEALLVDLNKSSCYDLVEQFCVCISKHLSVMQRQRECPEECKEAVPSLMFAAARFADLSELRELRKIFAERYGNSLESFENQEFVEKLTPKPPTMDKKLQLLRNIAQEFSIRWDSQAFAQKMSNTLASTQDRSRKQESFQGSNGGYKYHNGTEDSVPKRENWDVSSKGRQELTDDGYEPRSNMKDTFSRKDNQDLSSRGRREVADDEYKPKRNNLDNSSHGGRECFNDEYKLRKDTCPEKNNEGISSHERPEATPSYTTRQKMKADYKDNSVANSINKIVEDDTESIKPFYNNVIPPPYVKPRGRNHRTNSEALHTSYDYNEAPLDPPSHSRDVAKNRSNKTRTSSDYVDYNRQVVGATRVDGHGDEKDYHDQDDLIVGKREPRSVRRKPKPSPGHDNTGNFDRDEVVKRNPNHRRREDARQDQILCNDVPKDEQEKIMDELLIQNNKKPSTYEPGKVRTGLKAPPSHHSDADTGKSPHSRSTDKAHLNSVLTHTPARAVSLPPEPTTPTEMARGPARASSFQPESLNPVAHVHPKLPEYDVLAAHFAALRGR